MDFLKDVSSCFFKRKQDTILMGKVYGGLLSSVVSKFP